METRRALQMARDAEVDLVEVAPNSDPPVCRLLDYGKLLYLSSKKEKESKRGQKSTEQKEVRFRPNIGIHDLNAKVRKVREFIDDGSKVKLTVRFPRAGGGPPAVGAFRTPAGCRRVEGRGSPGASPGNGGAVALDGAHPIVAEGRRTESAACAVHQEPGQPIRRKTNPAKTSRNR